jgi:hypothetical protein
VVIPVFEYLLDEYETRVKLYKRVNHEPPDAPVDHLAINLRAAWAKLVEYYSKLDDSVIYDAAVTLCRMKEDRCQI